MHALPPRGRRRERVPRRVLRRRVRGLRRPALHVLRRSGGRAPVLRRGRPRLDDRRRERDPRPGSTTRGRWRCRKAPRRSSPACSATRSSRASACAPRPGSAATRCRSRRPRSPSPPSTSARSTVRRSSWSGRARWAPASRPRCVRAVSRRSGSRTAPSTTRRPPPSASAAEAIPLSEIADTLVDADVLLSSTASPAGAHRALHDRDGDGVPRRPPAPRRRRRAARATSTPACARSTT